MVEEGQFREDLYYRLCTFPIHLPPLRERRDDIGLLAAALLERVAPKRKLRISEPAMDLLQAQNYPGNVRELRNLLERTALLCDGDTLEAGHVQQALRMGLRPQPQPQPLQSQPADAPSGETLESIERAALKQMVQSHQGSRAELAARLGISDRSLYRKIRALD
jgi:DNA-binding NtrC family response regulator